MRDADQLTPDVLVELSRFAELAHIALGNLDAWTALTEQAACDALTGLPNRRSFDSHLHREIDAAARGGDPLSLILLDIDHFKAVNDTHGHPVGDRVLAEVAAVLGSVCRQSEMIARIGGEEFAWLLPRTSLALARHAAERARHSIDTHDFGAIGPLTISLGITTAADPTSPAELISAADTGLYQAKREGRNRAVTYQPNQPDPSRAVADANPR
jgi:diguanylate cyclase (GGDEF)-like protein